MIPIKQRRSSKVKKALGKYKSLFEKSVAEKIGEDYEYEPDRLPFTQPAKKRSYTPDFKIGDKTYIECKGLFSSEDRAKMLWVREQHPDVIFYILFQNSNVKIRKGSKKSYGDWATENGFQWADYRNGIPKGWFST